MSTTDDEVSSYFDLPPRTQPTGADTDAVSPFSVPSAATTSVLRLRSRPHLLKDKQSRSDSGSIRLQHAINTIHEENGHSVSESVSYAFAEATTQTVPWSGRNLSLRTSSRHSSEQSGSLQSRTEHLSSETKVAAQNKSELIQTTKLRPSAFWKRSHSSSSIFDRSSSGLEASSSSREHRNRAISQEHSQVVITPLRPPVRASPTLVSAHTSHHVKIEKPFPDLGKDAKHSGSLAKEEVKVESASRRSSIKPLQIFSAPLHAVRQFRSKRVSVTSNSESIPKSQRLRLLLPGKDPKSGWHKEQVSNHLPRVSILLQDIKSLGTRGRACSDQSVSSGVSKIVNGKSDSNPPLIRLERAMSMEMIDSNESSRSSFLKLRMGRQPPNTPEEQATYKIKRSPSAETEEFLKIDISIRGGTSYLPSEARRIHTPPLPVICPDGKQRGFFFDYNLGEEQVANRPDMRHSHKSAHITKNHDIAVVGNSRSPRSFKDGCCVKVGDWYETQLAQFDSYTEDLGRVDNNLGSGSLLDHPHPSGFSVRQQKLYDEAQLDHSIPEHLPTSPMCPRNPRYWRVIKGKGSQFRGCWMHGFGEYEKGRIPGSKPAATF